MSAFRLTKTYITQIKPFGHILEAEDLTAMIRIARSEMNKNANIKFATIADPITDMVLWDSRTAKPEEVKHTKPEHYMLDPMILPAETIWPTKENVKGKFVASGHLRDELGKVSEEEARTSLLVSMNVEQGYIETLNSIYWIV